MSLAEDIVDGEICASCMMPFKKPHGYPVVCNECFEDGWTQYQKAIYPVDHGPNYKEESNEKS